MVHPKPFTTASGPAGAPPPAQVRGLRPLDAVGTGAAIVTTIFWGSAGVAARIGAADLPPWTLAALQGWLAFAILALVMLWRRPAWPRDPAGVRIEESEAEVVQRIFAWYVEDGLTLYGIAHRLIAEGIPTPTGRPFWNPSSVQKILRNLAMSDTSNGRTLRGSQPSRCGLKR